MKETQSEPRVLPITVQRRMIVEALTSRKDHPTAEQIFHDVRARVPEISKTTVYRALETLCQYSIARKVCHPGAAARYEIEMHRHHHLVCRDCEKMLDFEDSALDTLPLPGFQSGFQIEDYSIQFRGLCSDCAAKQSGEQKKSVQLGGRKSKLSAL